MILVIMYVKIFKTDMIIIFIGNLIMFDVTLTDNFQYQSQLVDTDNITL